MDIKDLVHEGREIWGDEKLTLEQIIIRLLVGVGDLGRLARTSQEGGVLDQAELEKEMGNVIFSTLRWCDDLGIDPEACIEAAKQAQRRYAQQLAK